MSYTRPSLSPLPAITTFTFRAVADAAASPRLLRARARRRRRHDAPVHGGGRRGLAERGIATLRYQFPYMERGGKRPDPPKLAHATVRAAVARGRAALPGLPLIAGGKSFGGRMTSQAQAPAPLPGVRGLAFLGFPLHPAGKPSRRARASICSTCRCRCCSCREPAMRWPSSTSSSRFARRSASAPR